MVELSVGYVISSREFQAMVNTCRAHVALITEWLGSRKAVAAAGAAWMARQWDGVSCPRGSPPVSGACVLGACTVPQTARKCAGQLGGGETEMRPPGTVATDTRQIRC